MSKQIVGQCRETPEKANLSLVSLQGAEAILKDPRTGELDLFILDDDHPGWVIEIEGQGFRCEPIPSAQIEARLADHLRMAGK
jgi:hypothetical protein